MAHEIATIDGKPAVMFVGELPWHGLGQQFEARPHTAREVMKAAGLDWEVDLKPVYVLDDGEFHDFPEYRATVRVDGRGRMSCPPFGLVGKDYRVMQNTDAFKFFDPLVATGGITYETAGALGQGERVWILARVCGDMRIKGKDEIKRYLLKTHSKSVMKSAASNRSLSREFRRWSKCSISVGIWLFHAAPNPSFLRWCSGD